MTCGGHRTLNENELSMLFEECVNVLSEKTSHCGTFSSYSLIAFDKLKKSVIYKMHTNVLLGLIRSYCQELQ